MVLLAMVELLAGRRVSVNLPDPVKGERIVLLTTWRGVKAQELVKAAHGLGLGRLCIPARSSWWIKCPCWSRERWITAAPGAWPRPILWRNLTQRLLRRQADD